jgi:hypothetical protein
MTRAPSGLRANSPNERGRAMDEYERNQQALHDERMRARKQFKDALDEIGRLRKELDKAHRLISQSIGWQR